MTDDYLLGNAALHERFFVTTEILAKLVSRAPRSASIAQLESESGRPGDELRSLCEALACAGIVRRDPQEPAKWQLAAHPSEVTLEDVLRCTLEQQSCATVGSGTAQRAATDVDLLVMQATIAINQSVFRQLRQFSLDRVKASATGVFPAARRFRRFDEEFDASHSGREAAHDSPVHAAA